MLKIFIICGEVSGDLLASKVVEQIKATFKGEVKFYGLAGEELKKQGLDTLFEISQLSIMGFVDVFKNIFLFKKLIKQTAEKIAEIKPDVVLSVDSGGFCFRVCKMAKDKMEKDKIAKHLLIRQNEIQDCETSNNIACVKSFLQNICKDKMFKKRCGKDDVRGAINTKFYHYVAPAVWAYGKERGKKLAKIYDAMFCLFDFEPPYFTKYGLDAISVPNPYFATQNDESTQNFVEKNNITKPIIAITLGSRAAEVKIHANIIKSMLNKDLGRKNPIFKNYTLIFLALPRFFNYISTHFNDFNNCKVVANTQDKLAVLQNAAFAIAKSGTNVMEFLTRNIKTIVFYKMHPLNCFIGRLFIKAKFANIINIIEDKMLVPEFVQSKCTADNLTNAVLNMQAAKFDGNLQEAFAKASEIIGKNSTQNAPQIISKYIIDRIKKHG